MLSANQINQSYNCTHPRLFNELWKPVFSLVIITKIVRCVKPSGAKGKQLLCRNTAHQSVIVNYKRKKNHASQLNNSLSSLSLTPYYMLYKQINSAQIPLILMQQWNNFWAIGCCRKFLQCITWRTSSLFPTIDRLTLTSWQILLHTASPESFKSK